MSVIIRMKSILAITLIAIFILFSAFKWSNENTFDQTFKEYFSEHSTKLLNDALQLYEIVEKKDFNQDSAKVWLSKVRTQYKPIEAFVIYFLPGDARFLNRAIVPEMEEDDEISAYVIPHGFQYIEILLYSDSMKFFRKQIKDEVDFVYSIMSKFNESISFMEFTERDVFEAMQMQLIRQFMLGFANFETGESRRGVQESAAVLKSIRDLLILAYPNKEAKNAESLRSLFLEIEKGLKFLSAVVPMQEPDYFSFYSKHYIPISEFLGMSRFLSVENETYNTTAVNYNIRSIFDPHAFNTFFFLPAKQLASREKVIELGRTLFFDPALSANNLRACASCHQPEKAFTDGLAISQAFEPGKKLTRNAPTIINSVLQRKLFHDGRAFTFEDQAGQVMSNPLEMHNDFSQVAIKLRKSTEYVKWFRKAFEGSDDTIISNRSILTAIAEYERSLVGMNSRFDKSVTGREYSISEDEKEGFNIYMGKGNCASCHFIPLFNGLMPPEYIETEWEILGVPSASVNGKKELDKDIGRAGIIDVEIFRHAFKSPTVRNIELTAPYMHNGVFRTLEEVIEFYDTGGGLSLGYDVPLQTLAADSLHLTAKEKFQLISFLKALTDTVGLTSIPETLPQFPGDDELNKRPIGGNY
jgi:cytochrome c peroxidase